ISGLFRKKKLIAVVPLSKCGVNLRGEKVPIVRSIEVRSSISDQVLPRNARYFNKTGVRKQNLLVFVSYDNALVEHFEDCLHTGEPFRLMQRERGHGHEYEASKECVTKGLATRC